MISSFKHIYEVDMMDTFLYLESSLPKNNSNKIILKVMKQDIDRFLEQSGISTERAWKNRLSLVILPNINLDRYRYWLHLFLFTSKSHRIKLILEYHYQNWPLKESFVNNAEFQIMSFLEGSPFPKKRKEDVLEEISMWIFYKRANAKSQKELNIQNNRSITTSALTRNIIISEDIIDGLVELLSKKCLVNKSDKDSLKQLLEGGTCTSPIQIGVGIGAFTDVFRRLKKEEFIYNDKDKTVIQWIHQNFIFEKKSNHPFEAPSITYMEKIFRLTTVVSKKKIINLDNIIK